MAASSIKRVAFSLVVLCTFVQVLARLHAAGQEAGAPHKRQQQGPPSTCKPFRSSARSAPEARRTFRRWTSSFGTNSSAGEEANKSEANNEANRGEPLEVRILALFSGTSRDLGLDHRLGRQVLKLAAARARKLNPEVAKIDIVVHSDESECQSASQLPSQVVEQFYWGAASAPTSCESGPESDSSAAAAAATCPAGGTGEPLASARRVDAILGPSCEHLIDLVARMAAYWRTPIYTTTSIGASFSRKHIYTTLTRLSPSINHLSMFIVKVMERFKWRHLAVLIDSTQAENVALLKSLDKLIDRLRFTIPIYRKTHSINSSSIIEHRASSSLARAEPGATATAPLGGLAGSWPNFIEPPEERPPDPPVLEHCTRELHEVLESVRRSARVILLLLNEPQVARRLLLCAHELRFNNGEFTFLALNLGLKSGKALPAPQAAFAAAAAGASGAPVTRSSAQTLDWFLQEDEENNLKARQMFESLMVFSVELPLGDEYSIFVEQTLDLAHQEFPEVRFERSSVGPIAVALHDSLLLAVEAHKRRQLALRDARLGAAAAAAANKRRLKANESRERPTTGQTDFANDDEQEVEGRRAAAEQLGAPLMWNEHYSSGLITSMQINSRGDQELDYVLSDMEPELGLMRPVASYSKETRQVLMLPASYVHWPARLNAATGAMLHNDEPPPDEPECGFTGEAERCVDRQNMYIALAVGALFAVLILAVLAASLGRYRKIKYQMQLDDYWWKINWNELHFLRSNAQLSAGSQCATSLARQFARETGAGGTVGASNASSLVSANSANEAGRGAARGQPNEKTPQPSAVPIIVTSGSLKAADHDQHDQHDQHDHDHASASGLQRRKQASLSGGSQVALSQLGDKSSILDICSKVLRSELSTVVRHSSLALYRQELVIVKQLNGKSIEVSRELLVELKSIRELCNENLARLVGLCLEPEHLAAVYEFCSRGNLQDLLLNQSISIDWNFKYSIIGDIINGLNFIHTTLLDCHGRLKSTNLVLDSRFTVKLTDFGLKNLYSQLDLIESQEHEDQEQEQELELELELDEAEEAHGEAHGEAHDQPDRATQISTDRQRRLSVTQTIYNMDSVSVRAEKTAAGGQSSPLGLGLQQGAGGLQRPSSGRAPPNRMRIKNRGSARFFWTAPEHLRQRQPHLASSKRGDIYSLAIIFYEIFTRKEPYYFGTNAKPRWQLIKREQLRHQTEQRTHAATNALVSLGSRSGSIQLAAGLLNAGSSRPSLAGSGSQLHAATGAISAARVSGSQRSQLGSAPTSKAGSRGRKLRSQASVGPLPSEHPADSVAGGEGDGHASRSSSIQLAKAPVPQLDEPSGQAARGDQVRISIDTGGAPQTAGIGEQRTARKRGSSVLSRDSANAPGSGVGVGVARGGGHESTEAGSRARTRPAPADGHEELLDADEILDQLRMGVQPEPVRPHMPDYLLQEVDARMLALLRSCWHETPALRPSAGRVRAVLRKLTKGATAKNYLDNLLDRLQAYAAELERIVDGKSADIMAEKQRTEELLYQLVPKFVADKLKRDEPIVPQVFDGVTIFFSDIVGFEKYAAVMSPSEQVDLLNVIYASFDSIISSFDVTKIEVILDQFLVAAGISFGEQEKPPPASGQQASEQPAEQAAGGQHQEQPGAGGRDECATPLAKPKRRLLRALKGSQTSEERAAKQARALKKQESVGRETDELAEGRATRATPTPAGLPDADHYKRASAEQIARMALCIRDLVKSFNFRQNLAAANRDESKEPDESAEREPRPACGGPGLVSASFNIRVGIHSGKVCAGIVGVKRPKFCLIGDTVNVASRMHTNSKANRIQISTDTRELLRHVPGFNIEPRGRIEVKGKGAMETYWLESSY